MSMKLPRAVSELVPKLAGFRLAYERLVEPPAPINLTLSITNMCNSRCQSCDIWKIYPAEKDRLEEELSVDEIEKIFRSVGRVYFFNISGGEPFLRKDIVDIVRVGCEQLRPSVVHIPTGTKHWHGAKADSWLSHLAFITPGEDVSNEWLEPVTDEEYNKLKEAESSSPSKR